MQRSFIRKFAALSLGTVLLATSAVQAFAYTGQELSSQASVPIEAARKAALDARPGKITDEELEKEGGGSGLRYSFDIQSKGVKYEVGVDAKTGKILENAPEGAHPD